MVCRTLDVAQVVSRSSNLDCVTMEVGLAAQLQYTQSHVLIRHGARLLVQHANRPTVQSPVMLHGPPPRYMVHRHTTWCIVTLQGDQARRKGTLSGGWLDPNRSKLTANKGLKVCLT